tara:strand:+ start:133 stop:717 length:585 start_codon:yes stop_codon:yes gene_type:complete
MEKWEYACENSFLHAKVILKNWKDYNLLQKMVEASVFYSYVFNNGTNSSGLISKEALNLKADKRTKDHWNSARLYFRAMMELYPELLNNFKKFKYYFRELCQSTIDITPHQNDIVKFKSDRDEGIKIKYLTIEKYEICKDKDDNIGIEFFNSGKGSCKVKKHDYVTGFPLKELVPEWITEFESLYLVKENNETE